MWRTKLILTLTLTFSATLVLAFVEPQGQHQQQRQQQLDASSPPSHWWSSSTTSLHDSISSSSSSGHLAEMDDARRQFESMIGPLLFADVVPPLLTNAGRKRRHLEIHLLQSLRTSDDAVDELVSLWIHECPCQVVSTETILFKEYYCSNSNDSAATLEKTLRNILAECPVRTWPEPAARLALLLFLQGRYVESQEYVDQVLSVKPWHFEVLQMQVWLRLAAVGRKDGLPRAISAARAGLPPLSQPRKRAAWIQTAASQATAQLEALEEASACAKAFPHPRPSTTAWQ